jgi:hypothetical protein
LGEFAVLLVSYTVVVILALWCRICNVSFKKRFYYGEKKFQETMLFKAARILLRILKRVGNAEDGRKDPSKEKFTGMKPSFLRGNFKIKHFYQREL